MASYYLHIDRISMRLHCLHSSQSTSILHDDFAVVGFTQSEDREARTALFTHLKQIIDTILRLIYNCNLVLHKTTLNQWKSLNKIHHVKYFTHSRVAHVSVHGDDNELDSTSINNCVFHIIISCYGSNCAEDLPDQLLQEENQVSEQNKHVN